MPNIRGARVRDPACPSNCCSSPTNMNQKDAQSLRQPAAGVTKPPGRVQKVAYEAPPGVRRNLHRSLVSVVTPAAAGLNTTQLQLQALLAWFHAVVQVCVSTETRHLDQGCVLQAAAVNHCSSVCVDHAVLVCTAVPFVSTTLSWFEPRFRLCRPRCPGFHPRFRLCRPCCPGLNRGSVCVDHVVLVFIRGSVCVDHVVLV